MMSVADMIGQLCDCEICRRSRRHVGITRRLSEPDGQFIAGIYAALMDAEELLAMHESLIRENPCADRR